jgi:glycosyltransferase involved in cell wall biosynthesis
VTERSDSEPRIPSPPPGGQDPERAATPAPSPPPGGQDPERHASRIPIALLGGSLRLGGAEHQIVRLLRGLAAGSFRPILVLKRAEGPLLPEVRRLGVPIHELGFRRLYTPAGWRAVGRLRRILREERVRILQSYLYGSHLLGTLALAGWRDPLRPHHVLSLRGHRLPRPWLLRPFYRWAGPRASAVVAVSSDLARTAATWGIPPERLVVLPNGVPIPDPPDAEAVRATRETLGIPGNVLLVGMVGNFHPGKGQEDLLRAAAELVRQPDLPPWRILLVGDGRTRPMLERFAAEAGLGDHVAFLGHRSDVDRLLPALDLFVFPSHSEGMPNALLEAMAAGLACLASDIPVHRVVLGQAGRLFRARSVPDLAGGLAALLRASQAERAAMGRAARERIRTHYSVEVMVAAYRELYERLLGG